MKTVLISLSVVTLCVFGSNASVQSVDECKPSCPFPEALFHHPRDCTKFFHCAHNFAFEKDCPAGLHFDAELLRCILPVATTCLLDPEASCSEYEKDYSDGTDTYSDLTTAGLIPTTTNEASECKPECPSEEGLLANPRDCSKYYSCAHGVSYEMSCPGVLEFSVNDGQCEYHDDAQCIADPSASCDVVITAAPSEYEGEPPVVVQESAESEEDTECEPTCGSTYIMAHPQECGKFVLCVEAKAHVMNCPAGLHYSAEHLRCEYHHIAKCTASLESPCE